MSLYEGVSFCPQCGANLITQKGFTLNKDSWVCVECGQLLYDGDIYEGDKYPGVMWFCDKCEAVLNRQTGFDDCNDVWTCTECQYINTISADEVYEDKTSALESRRQSFWGEFKLKRQRKEQYKISIVKKYLDLMNPYELLPEAPEDEFIQESIKIAKLIKYNDSTEKIASKMADVLSKSFDEGFTEEECKRYAVKIKEELERI